MQKPRALRIRIALCLFVFLTLMMPAPVARASSQDPSGIRFGVHFANLKYFDPMGIVFRNVSDTLRFNDMTQKIAESGARSIKVLVYTYSDSPKRAQWVRAQQEMIAELHRRFPRAALILRLAHEPYVDASKKNNDSAVETQAEEMARNFQPIVNNITNVVQDASGDPPIWIVIANEPNDPSEGFGQDPAYFNSWFKKVVWYFWNRYPILSRNGTLHALGYPGLSPYYDPLLWYGDPSTLDILRAGANRQCWCNFISLHVYWQTGQASSALGGEFYKVLWKQAIAPANPYLPVMIDEWGSSSYDDMDSVKIPEYLAWLTNLKDQTTIPRPQLMATSGFILDGTDEWRAFFWTHALAQAIGGLNL